MKVDIKAFGTALGELLRLRNINQTQLAKMLGTTQSMVSAWKAGQYEPPSPMVFRMEELLDVQPGTLSRHLGIFPWEQVERRRTVTVEEAIMVDGLLDEPGKKAVLAVYGVYAAGIAATVPMRPRAVKRTATTTARRPARAS